MPLDPRTPVLIGSGQINQRDEESPLEPVELMAAAARRAAVARVLEAVDAIRIVKLLSWRYRDPGLLLGQRIGAADFTTRYSGMGGNTPQSLVNQACLDIQAGNVNVVLLGGAETWRTRARLRAAGVKPDWTHQDYTVPTADGGDTFPMVGDAQQRVNLTAPVQVYALFEQALRIAAGESRDEHRLGIGELWSQFSAVAAGNPHAWLGGKKPADEIWRPGTDNRMISWPYTKLLNSNNMVDQAAVVVLASVQAATRLGVPSDQWVFPHAGTDAHDTYDVAERAELHRSPAIRIAGRRALELAGVGVDDLDVIDIYSCFPSAVQVAAAELGLPVGEPARPLTVTGGLTFAGGPWNNYVTHAIATMAGRLTANGGGLGLVTANGGYLTKHSIGVYGTEPPGSGFRWCNVQSEVDREPTRKAAVQWQGVGTVESWTTPHNRDGTPEKTFVAVRTPDDARTIAVLTAPDEVAASVRDDIARGSVRVSDDGTARLEELA